MTTQVTLDEILAALVSACTAALPTVRVFDGPVVTGAAPNHALAIGHSDVPDEPGATVSDGSEGETQLPEWITADVFVVTNTVRVQSGSSSDSAIPALRIAAFDTLAVVRGLIVGQQPLGLAGLAWARVGSLVYTPQMTQNVGASVTLAFDLTLQSRPST